MLRNIENQSGSMALGSKRTADLMLRQFTGMPLMSPSTETVSSDTQSDTENYAAKKPKLEDDQFSADKINPSKVVHVRNLPQDTSETDIMALAAPFGKVTNMILMRNKRQAFVEMGDLIQAMNFVRQHQNPVNPAFVRSQTVQVQYSATYSELKPGQRSHANGMKPTPVLHINVDNLVMSVPLATLHSIFSQFGVVEKIITFNKNNQFQALIQMNDVDSAQLAKMVLDGKSIYPNCCVLRIDFSKMLSVNVKYNNEKSRDYTNPNLPSGDDTLPGANSSALNNSSIQAAATGMSPHIQPIVNSTQLQALGLVPSYVPFKQGAMVNPLNPLATLYNMNNYRMLGAMNPLQAPGIHSLAAHAYPQALQPSLTTQSSSRLPFASSPAAVAIQSMAANQLQALSHFPPSAQTPTSTSATTLQSLPETSMSSQLPLAQVATAAQLGHPYTPQLLAAYNPFHALQQHQMLNLSHQLLPVSATPSSSISATQLGSSGHCTSPDVSTMSTPSPIIFGPATGSVVLVSNLNSKNVRPDALINLFGLYGDVVRIKILYHKQDTALVQYSDPVQAANACKYLDKLVFWGNEVRVMPSRHTSIQMPADPTSDGAKLTQDYTDSPLNRFKRKGNRYASNVFPPSPVLHVSNLQHDLNETSPVFSLFSQYGQVLGVKFFDKDRSMALVKMASLSEATEALMGMHHLQVDDSHKIRVSFSKFSI